MDLPVWQALRSELHPKGVEIVTVSLELSGPEASRSYIEAARPEHPSLLDPTHQMDSLFGVVNIPSVVWIDEEGVIVRPAESGWPGPRPTPKDTQTPPPPVNLLLAILATGQDRASYADAIRDWADNGAQSQYVLRPAEVVARSQPRPLSVSEAAAHFELANHLWRAGERAAAIVHFNACHRLQPENWTYKRQAWSLVSNEQVGGPRGRFVQGPAPGEEDSWPFESDFRTDVSKLGPGEYYPATL